MPASAKPLTSSVSLPLIPERAPIQPPSEFALGTDPTRQMNLFFFFGGVNFQADECDSSLQMQDVACQEHAAATGSLLAQNRAELIWLQNVTQLRAVESQVLQYCNSLNSIKNRQLLQPDTPSHADSRGPPRSAPAHSPASPGVPQGTAKALENNPPISSTVNHTHDRNTSI